MLLLFFLLSASSVWTIALIEGDRSQIIRHDSHQGELIIIYI